MTFHTARQREDCLNFPINVMGLCHSSTFMLSHEILRGILKKTGCCIFQGFQPPHLPGPVPLYIMSKAIVWDSSISYGHQFKWGWIRFPSSSLLRHHGLSMWVLELTFEAWKRLLLHWAQPWHLQSLEKWPGWWQLSLPFNICNFAVQIHNS